MSLPKRYDPGNVFARILRGEIPAKVVHQTEHALAFQDINPQAPVHVLVIPRGPYVDLDHFITTASVEELVGFWRCVGETAQLLNLVDDGFRLLSNCGANSHQEVPHLHIHLFGGRPLGPMLVQTAQAP